MKTAHPLIAAAQLAASCSAGRRKKIHLILLSGGVAVCGSVLVGGHQLKLKYFVGWEYIDTTRTIDVIRELDARLIEHWRAAGVRN